MYTEDDALPSQNAHTPSDPHLGRLTATHIPPPHTARSIARYILKKEGIHDVNRGQIYADVADESPLDPTKRMTILNGIGPGSRPENAIAVVLTGSGNEPLANSPVSPTSPQTYASPPTQQYGYPSSQAHMSPSQSYTSPTQQYTVPAVQLPMIQQPYQPVQVAPLAPSRHVSLTHSSRGPPVPNKEPSSTQPIAMQYSNPNQTPTPAQYSPPDMSSLSVSPRSQDRSSFETDSTYSYNPSSPYLPFPPVLPPVLIIHYYSIAENIILETVWKEFSEARRGAAACTGYFAIPYSITRSTESGNELLRDEESVSSRGSDACEEDQNQHGRGNGYSPRYSTT